MDLVYATAGSLKLYSFWIAKELLMFLKQNDMVTPMNHKYACLVYKKKETYSLFI